MTCAPRKQSKTYKVPKRPYEAARLDAELKVGFNYFNGGWRYCRVGWTCLDTGRLDKGISHGRRAGRSVVSFGMALELKGLDVPEANSALSTYLLGQYELN